VFDYDAFVTIPAARDVALLPGDSIIVPWAMRDRASFRWIAARCCIAALWTVLGAGGGQAQAENVAEFERPKAALGAPSYWLNAGDVDRIPLRDRPLRFSDGLFNPAPPSPKRTGLTPRLGATLSVRETEEDSGVSDTVLTFAPGLFFQVDRPGLRVSADYAIEATEFLRNPNLSQLLANHGGFFDLGADIDARTSVTFALGHLTTQDTSAALVSGAVPEDTKLSSTVLQFGVSRALTDRTQAEFGVSAALLQSDETAANDVLSTRVNAGVGATLSAQDRLTLSFDAAHYDFNDPDDAVAGAIDVAYTRDISRRLSVSGVVGWLGTNAQWDQHHIKLGGEVIATSQYARYALSLDRSILAAPGLPYLLLADGVSAEVDARLGSGLLFTGAVAYQRLEPLVADEDTISVSSVSARLSYAFNRRDRIWSSFAFSGESSGGDWTPDTRLTIGLSRAFD